MKTRLTLIALTLIAFYQPASSADIPAPAPAATTTPPPAALPDIAIEGSLNEVLIGGGTGMAARRVTFRHRQLVMYPDWAVGGTKKGECKIQIMYNLTNIGDASTGKPFKVQLLNNGKVVGEDLIETLDSKQSRVVTTHGLFTQGHHWFTLRMDPDNAIQEANEENNDQKFDYTLNGKCGPKHRARTPGQK